MGRQLSDKEEAAALASNVVDPKASAEKKEGEEGGELKEGEEGEEEGGAKVKAEGEEGEEGGEGEGEKVKDDEAGMKEEQASTLNPDTLNH